MVKDVISLGLGVQSTALYYMSSMGELPRADYAIFADTGREKAGTIRYLRRVLIPWMIENKGIPILVVKRKNLYRDLLNQENSTGQRFSSIPAFTKNDDGSTGMLRRQCTLEYKIAQVDKEIRRLHGLAKYKRMPTTNVWKGISLDEIERMTQPQQAWKVEVYPFVNYKTSKTTAERIEGKRMKRIDIINWYFKNGLEVPPKSACTFCPYQSDASWASMKKNEPEDFKSAVRVDEAIRNSTKKGIKNQAFLHDSLIPLKDIVFKEDAGDLWKGECSGNCHI